MLEQAGKNTIELTFPELKQQCDQIGRILKVLGNKFAAKSSLKRLLTFGLFFKKIS